MYMHFGLRSVESPCSGERWQRRLAHGVEQYLRQLLRSVRLIRQQVFLLSKSGNENYYTRVTSRSICEVSVVQILKVKIRVNRVTSRKPGG